jgi:hypothetical protein
MQFRLRHLGLIAWALLVTIPLQSCTIRQTAAGTAETDTFLPTVQHNGPPTEPGAPGTDPDVPVGFRETFDGDPAAPQPWQPANWDVTVHSRDQATWNTLETVQAAHGPDCSPPPATHPVSNYADAVYICRNHMMTAINASGYGVIYLTPDHMVDFSQGEAVIRVDMSTLMTSDRDWWDIWITPYNDQLQLPLEDFYPDLNGPPRRALQIIMMRESMNVVIYDEFAVAQESEFDGTIPTQWSVKYSTFLTPDAARRDTFEVRVSSNHLKVGMPDYNFWWIDSPIEPLDWNRGIVQFGHHSYNPTKCEHGTCGAPNTWHWDNVEISPTIPFTIIRADQRFVSPDTAASVAFPEAAPADAHLRFAGIGTNLEVSFDNGTTWQTAQRQAQKEYGEGSFISYWMPVPPETTSVSFRGQSWWGGDWHVRDISIWSPAAGPQ